jgi:ABC-type branched-subunit amino acid transport system substrate-binding protein
VLKAKQANADALFVYTNEDESGRVLRELKKQGYDKPMVGETTLTGQKVIELAGDAANGAIAHVASRRMRRCRSSRRSTRSSRRSGSTRPTTMGSRATRPSTSSRP